MAKHASYRIEKNVPELGTAVVIRDIGHDKGCLTITNDVEFVVGELWANDVLDADTKLFYYDSNYDLDEIVHKKGRFIQFKPGPFRRRTH